MTTKTKANSTHAIFLSLPFQGHVNPSIALSLKLASKGLIITFLVFEAIHQELTQARTQGGLDSNDIFEEFRNGSDNLEIQYRVISDGLPLEFDRREKLAEYSEWWFEAMYDKVEEEVGKIVSSSEPKADVLIADTFYPWASKIAKKSGLRFASFWTQPALVFNLCYHVHLLRENGHFDCPDKRKDPIEYIPGVQQIRPKDLMGYLQANVTSTIEYKIIFGSVEDTRSADYVLCNSVQELEPQVVSTLQALRPFYPIGPMFLTGPTKSVIPSSLWVESCCTEWLRSKAHGSVLYVSFGSLAFLTKDDVQEIAHGLNLSNVDFVWVFRPNVLLHETSDLLPVGFEEEIRGRGIVVSWTNQSVVLTHPAIGGFLTHCGWNSVLEGVWYEVPMLCSPIFTDQPTNRKLVVDDWKIGVNLCDEGALTRDKIAIQISNFMKSKDELKPNIKDAKRKLENAFGADGSSEKNIELFIENLK